MWADGRGRYYEVIPSGDQHFAVRTSDEAGRVVRFTKHLIRREPLTGIFLWQGAHRTFELDARGAPDHLLWRCRAGGRSFTWTPTSPMNEGHWPYPLNVERANMHEEGVKNQAAPPCRTPRRAGLQAPEVGCEAAWRCAKAAVGYRREQMQN